MWITRQLRFPQLVARKRFLGTVYAQRFLFMLLAGNICDELLHLLSLLVQRQFVCRFCGRLAAQLLHFGKDQFQYSPASSSAEVCNWKVCSQVTKR
ncbi:hypothetical protein CRENBAI_017550 [Crenichthys baileyi]|uniref:Secreted protein n=1 Tax=Crenichthys baileyi TaxID=28760 RepID=A0AAV9SPL6_9TELE